MMSEPGLMEQVSNRELEFRVRTISAVVLSRSGQPPSPCELVKKRKTFDVVHAGRNDSRTTTGVV